MLINTSNKNGTPGWRRISRLREFGDKDPCSYRNPSDPRFPFPDKISSALQSVLRARKRITFSKTPKYLALNHDCRYLLRLSLTACPVGERLCRLTQITNSPFLPPFYLPQIRPPSPSSSCAISSPPSSPHVCKYFLTTPAQRSHSPT